MQVARSGRIYWDCPHGDDGDMAYCREAWPVCSKCGKRMVYVDAGVYAHTTLSDATECGAWRPPTPTLLGPEATD